VTVSGSGGTTGGIAGVGMTGGMAKSRISAIDLAPERSAAADQQLALDKRPSPSTPGSAPDDGPATSTYAAGGTDVFDRTFQMAVADAGLPAEALARHIPIFRQTVGAGQTVLLVARCGRLDHASAADHLIVVTRDRLAITSESRSLRRVRLHLNAATAALLNVRWQVDPGASAVEFAATALDGVRERFLIEARDPVGVSHIDAVLGYVVRPAGSRRLNPVEPVMPSWMNPAGAF
jgi:hypothetical protein